MSIGMTTAKIAISLPTPLVDHVRARVKTGRARSVSAYVANAVECQKRDEDLRVLLDEIFAETGGPPTAAERAAARRNMGLPARSKPVRPTPTRAAR